MSSTPQRFSSAELGAALAVIVIWGSNFVAMKFALRDFTPFQLGAARYVFAVLPLVLFIRPPKVAWKWGRCTACSRAWGNSVFCSARSTRA